MFQRVFELAKLSGSINYYLMNYKFQAKSSDEEEKLLKALLKGYNKLIRPVKNSSDHVVIYMDLVLLQLINIVSRTFFFFKLETMKYF